MQRRIAPGVASGMYSGMVVDPMTKHIGQTNTHKPMYHNGIRGRGPIPGTIRWEKGKEEAILPLELFGTSTFPPPPPGSPGLHSRDSSTPNRPNTTKHTVAHRIHIPAFPRNGQAGLPGLLPSTARPDSIPANPQRQIVRGTWRPPTYRPRSEANLRPPSASCTGEQKKKKKST
jgi:hypothetical protein